MNGEQYHTKTIHGEYPANR